MKRFFSLLICALLCIGITGCSKESGSIETQVSNKNSITESADETTENSKSATDERSDTIENKQTTLSIRSVRCLFW